MPALRGQDIPRGRPRVTLRVVQEQREADAYRGAPRCTICGGPLHPILVALGATDHGEDRP
jgi:ribosomal protein L34E